MKEFIHQHDYVVIGAGITGMAAAITAARNGLHVALVQDRPVLGGNAGKEIRILMSGACNANSAYWRETGLMEELLLENLHSNPTCSIEGWNLVLVNALKAENRVDLFLNTSVTTVTLAKGGGRLEAVRGYEMTAETWHSFQAPFFADCTGDGTIGVLAGNPFRFGGEARSEFGESLAQEMPQSYVMGDSIQFRARDAGRPVSFVRPPWARYELTDADFDGTRPIIREFRQQKGGFWWLEWGGNLDTVHDTANITDNVLAIVYSVWDYLKNRSPLRSELATWELEWVGALAGKRESRRLEGDHILTQNDIDAQRHFEDAVAYGGWGYDDHPPDGFFDRSKPSWHWYIAGFYNVPLRSLYARTVDNLFMAGRNISATHVAISNTRVMLTCGQLGEAIGAAAAVCVRHDMGPRRLIAEGHVAEVQRLLQRADHHIHAWPYDDPANLAARARVRASSELAGPLLEQSAGIMPLSGDLLWQFPVTTSRLNSAAILLDVAAPATLQYTIYAGPANGSTFPTDLLHSGTVSVQPGQRQWVTLPAAVAIARPGWHFYELKAAAGVQVHYGLYAPPGLKGYSVRPDDPIRPNPHSRWRAGGGLDTGACCLRLDPPQPVYAAANVVSPWARPSHLPNLWASQDTAFAQPEWLELTWDAPQMISEIDLLFDSSLDVHLTTLWTTYERSVMPALAKDYRLLAWDAQKQTWIELVAVRDNYLRHRMHAVPSVRTDRLRLEITATNGAPRAHVYSIRVY